MSIKISVKKAKVIHVNRWREARRPLLEALDVEQMIANETGDEDKQKEIISKKQELRDVTKTPLSNIKTIKRLKTTWPECLGPKPDDING